MAIACDAGGPPARMRLARQLLGLLALAAVLAPPAGALISAPIARTPPRPVGTVILLPGSGWANPTDQAQQRVWSNAAPLLFGAGYRTVAIDYRAGPAAGLASVRRAAGAERSRLRRGPLCLYGESSGGHLALLLAGRVRWIDCVITFGAPTSFSAYAEEAQAHPEEPGYQYAMDTFIEPVFGSDPAGWAPWEPSGVVTPVRTPVLMMICEDDPIVPVDQIYHVPGAKTYIPPRGDRTDPRDLYVHGSVSDSGLEAVHRRILDFVERARRGTVSGRRS
jgi:acetyl esterase/lipase